MTRNLKLVAPLLLAGLIWPVCLVNASQTPKFDREQLLVLNLNRGPNSCGYTVVTALKQTRTMCKDLDRARRQLEQIDISFARYKGKPDNRYLQPTSERLKQAEETALLLEGQLKDTYQELKSSIQQALILP